MKWKENPFTKALAFVVAVAAFAAAAIIGWYQLANFDVLWGGSSLGSGYTVRYMERNDRDDIEWLLDRYAQRAEVGELSVYQAQELASLEDYLDPANTNLRWQLLGEDGQRLYGNAEGAIPAQAQGLLWSSYERTEPASEAGTDPVTWRGELVLWLDEVMTVNDKYSFACSRLSAMRDARAGLLAVTILCTVGGLLLTIYLCAAAGHRRDRAGITLNWFHRIPGDVLLVVLGAAEIMLAAGAVELTYSFGRVPMYLQLILVGAGTVSAAAIALGLLVSFVVRCKAHTVIRNTLIAALCRWCRRTGQRIARAIPLVWKAAVGGLVYMLFTMVTVQNVSGLWLLGTLVVIAYLCLWAWQWKRIRLGTREIIGGNRDYHINSDRMLPDLRGHADELNNLGQSIAVAVEERMRSEHFKAELITNVSHDLKTPLTSIINYVDLLKKENIDNPKAAEYIEVLDRKSQRLKKLTEDLVEASKASTGSLSVLPERIDLTQLADQALAEYQERLEDRRLAVVRTMPEGPVWVEADGRHLWRVIDNLLSNCAKYALEGTRVYVSVQSYTDCAALSIKNISRDELNVPPEQLMERFVRGDASRTAEGSGLGLSIAQSLADLQHGDFEISIDGDLFKATVTLPLAEEQV